jgi:hypothetical protein
LTWPRNGAVIADSVLVCAEAFGAEAVSRIEFFADDVRVHEDRTPPYEFQWDLGGYPLGSAHQLWAVVVDTVCDCASSETLTVHSKWKTMAEDADDPGVGDLRRVCLRSTRSVLECRIELDCLSAGCIPDADVWVYLDADNNAATGLTAAISPGEGLNDIGADFCVECSNALFCTWHAPSHSLGCRRDGLVYFEERPPNAVEFGVNLKMMNFAGVINIVVAACPWPSDQLDVAPEPEVGHITYAVGDLSVGR